MCLCIDWIELLVMVWLCMYFYLCCVVLDLFSFDKVMSGSLIVWLNNDMCVVKQVFMNAVGDVMF